jgi:hypothetical protein
MHLQVCGGDEKGKNTRALARLAGAWRGDGMGAGARRACE